MAEKKSSPPILAGVRDCGDDHAGAALAIGALPINPDSLYSVFFTAFDPGPFPSRSTAARMSFDAGPAEVSLASALSAFCSGGGGAGGPARRRVRPVRRSGGFG